MKKAGIILSFAVTLGGLVLLPASLFDEDQRRPTSIPVNDEAREPVPVITVTDIFSDGE